MKYITGWFSLVSSVSGIFLANHLSVVVVVPPFIPLPSALVVVSDPRIIAFFGTGVGMWLVHISLLLLVCMACFKHSSGRYGSYFLYPLFFYWSFGALLTIGSLLVPASGLILIAVLELFFWFAMLITTVRLLVYAAKTTSHWPRVIIGMHTMTRTIVVRVVRDDSAQRYLNRYGNPISDPSKAMQFKAPFAHIKATLFALDHCYEPL